MKKIVILGNSAAGVKAAEIIRASDQESEISIFSFDGGLPANRDLFPDFIAGALPYEEVLYRPKDFYTKSKINIMFDHSISRINLKKNKIFCEDKSQIDFDVLLITETPEPRFPDIRGANKQGVFSCYRLSAINEIIKTIPLVENIVIQSDTFYGLRIASALSRKGKEVVLVTSHAHLLSPYLDLEGAQFVMKALESKGLGVMTGATISEILGDGEAKAVRLTSGKVIAGDMVIFAETAEDLRLFSDSSLELGKKILA